MTHRRVPLIWALAMLVQCAAAPVDINTVLEYIGQRGSVSGASQMDMAGRSANFCGNAGWSCVRKASRCRTARDCGYPACQINVSLSEGKIQGSLSNQSVVPRI